MSQLLDFPFSGEGGIRTLGGPKDHNGFRDRPIRPLWHLSAEDYTHHVFARTPKADEAIPKIEDWET